MNSYSIDKIKEEVLKGNRDALYHSRYWGNKRKEILERDNYECQICLRKQKRRLTRATTVHHIAELKDDVDRMLDDDNLISVCNQCHDEIHGRTTRHFNRPKKPITEEKW